MDSVREMVGADNCKSETRHPAIFGLPYPAIFTKQNANDGDGRCRCN